MKVTSSAIKNGYFPKKFGGNGDILNENKVPTYSIPFKIEDAPENTISYAVVLNDVDAYQTTKGYAWTHWTIANLTKTEVLENESLGATDFVQGVNSWNSPLLANQNDQLSSFYGGMTPPDFDHNYTLTVYALDTKLDLAKGFYLNQLIDAIKGHVLTTATVEAKYEKLV
ncbi:MAG: YbhB/YbcL family Raf kinase inhibitor-like protein [Culicoidibacterales bacterium]